MIEESDLDAAVQAGVIDPETSARLLAFVQERHAARADVRVARANMRSAPSAPKFDAVHVLYYAGALIVIGALGIFSTTAFSALGGWALTATAVLYAAGFTALALRLWPSPATRTPAGLAVAVAVSMTPLAIYGVQDALNAWALGARPGPYSNFFPLINASWVYMEIGTLVAGGLALRIFPFPFIVMILSVALWFLSMDGAALLLHGRPVGWDADWDFRRHISLGFGLAMMAFAWGIDVKAARLGDFGFWLHLFGVLTFWGALSSGSGGEWAQAAYCLINIALIAFGLFLNRRVYAVFGAIGLSLYLGHLASETFSDVLTFTFALSAIGLAIIFAGIALQRRQRAISAFVDAVMPAPLRALRPVRALSL